MLDQPSAQPLGIDPSAIRAELEAGNLDRAEHLCGLLLESDPSNGRFFNVAGNVAVRRQALDLALERFGTACRLAPGQPDFRLNRAMVLELRGDFDGAVGEYRTLVTAHPEFVPAIQRLAKILFKLDQLGECRDLMSRFWPKLSGNADMCCLAGAVQRQCGNAEEAKAYFKQAIRWAPDHLEARGGLAALAMSANEYTEVVLLLEPVAEQLSGHGELNLLLANAYEALEQIDKAAEQYERLMHAPEHRLQAAFSLGRIRKSQKQMRAAADAFRRAVDEQPDNLSALEGYAEVLCELQDARTLKALVPKFLAIAVPSPYHWNNFAVHVKSAKLVDEAIGIWRTALVHHPDVPQLYFNLANTLNELGRAAECEPFALLATRVNPRYARAFNLLAVSRCRQHKVPEAWDALRACLKIEPKMAEAHVNAGVLHRLGGNIRATVDAFRTAISYKPDYAVAHHNLSTLLLCEGELAEGFREFEWRWGTPNFPSPKRPFRQPIWKGQDVSNCGVALWMEQGIGDELMFAYFIPHMEKIAKRLLIECEERLVPLFRRSFEKAEVHPRTTPLQPAFNEPDIRYKVPIGHVCQYFWPELHQVIRQNWDIHNQLVHRAPGYLQADPDRVQYWREYLDRRAPGKLKVGFSWRSGMRGADRDPQFMETSEISRALGPNVAAVNLQYGSANDELAFLASPGAGLDFIHPEGIDLRNDLDDLAALMTALDLVVTAFTSVGQMAGALGVPTWIFYNSSEERIWQQLGARSIPWHPSIRLFFRQRPVDGWDAVIERLRAGVEQMVEADRG